MAFGLLTATVDVSAAGWIHGLKLAAVAVVAQAVYLLAGRLTPDWRRRGMAVVATLVSLAWPTPLCQLAVIAGGALAGRLVVAAPAIPPADDAPSPVSRRVGTGALVLFVMLLGILPAVRAIDGQAMALVDTFYRTGALVFGGGHVVLPLLHQGVVDPGWVGNDRFLAGYGAAQAVPGPLFSFAAYLGVVSSLPPSGVTGGLVALVSIYLPTFLLVFGALPFWHELRGSSGVRRFLAGTNAAVVGILAAALYSPIWTSTVGGAPDVAIAGAALAALATGRVPPVAIVGACAVLAQLAH